MAAASRMRRFAVRTRVATRPTERIDGVPYRQGDVLHAVDGGAEHDVAGGGRDARASGRLHLELPSACPRWAASIARMGCRQLSNRPGGGRPHTAGVARASPQGSACYHGDNSALEERGLPTLTTSDVRTTIATPSRARQAPRPLDGAGSARACGWTRTPPSASGCSNRLRRVGRSGHGRRRAR